MLSSTVISNAQSNFNIGLKAGINYATLPTNLNEVNNKEGKAGYNIGAFARIGNNIFFQPELNYTTFKSEYTYAGSKYKPKFQQANVPLMIGYKIINTEVLILRISAGPDLSYSLNNAKGPLQFDYKKINVGSIGNIGVDIGNLTLDARYSRGLTEINKGLEEKTGIFNFSIGVKIF